MTILSLDTKMTITNFFREYYLLLSFLFVLHLVIFISLSYEVMPVFVIVVLLVIAVFLFFNVKEFPLFLIAAIPLSQAIPIQSGMKEIGIFPEYFIIPVVGFFLLNNRIKEGNFQFLRTGLLIPVFVFLIAAVVSLFLGSYQIGLSKATQGIGTLYVFILNIIFFIILLDYFNDEKKYLKVFYYILITSSIISLVAIVQFLYLSQTTAGAFRVNSLFDNILSKRATGNPNTLGTFLMIATLIAVGLRNQFSVKQKKLVYLSILLNLIAVLFTASRSSLLGIAIGIIVLGFIQDKKLLLWLIPFSGVLIYGITTIPRMITRLTSVFEIVTDPKIIKLFSKLDLSNINWAYIDYFGISGYDSDIVAGAARFSAWINAVKMIELHPVFGIGLQMNLYYYNYPTAENFLLDIAVMTGLIGVLTFIWVFSRLIKIMKKAKKQITTEFESAFFNTYKVIFIGIIIVSLTGSVMFTLKLLLLFTFLTSLICKIALKEK